MENDLVEIFEAAVREHALMGSKDPESWDEIERNYLEAKTNLLEALGVE